MKLLRRRRKEKEADPQPLRIGGIAEAPVTPEPDEAERAAQELLEMMSERPAPGPSLLGRGINAIKRRKKPAEEATTPLHQQGGAGGGSAYYHALAERIRQAHETARLRAVRFVAFCEQELRSPGLPLYGKGSLGQLEAELYKRIDIIEKYGGELKNRWQRCLAEVTVRLMNANDNDDENR